MQVTRPLIPAGPMFRTLSPSMTCSNGEACSCACTPTTQLISTAVINSLIPVFFINPRYCLSIIISVFAHKMSMKYTLIPRCDWVILEF